jgi:hypothetical protein
MTTDTRSSTGPRAALAAVRFAVGGFVGCLGLAATVRLGGVLALVAPPLAFFAGAFWAAGELRLGLRGRLGFGAAVMMGAFGSFLVLVSTQAMTGRENPLIAITVPFLIANTLAAFLGLQFLRPGRADAFWSGVLGFAIGAALSGGIAAAAMGTRQLSSYTLLALIPIPGVLGGTVTAWALNQPASASRASPMT